MQKGKLGGVWQKPDLSFCPEAPVPVATRQQPGAWDQLKSSFPIVGRQRRHKPVLLCQAENARNAVHSLTGMYMSQGSLTVLQLACSDWMQETQQWVSIEPCRQK